MKLKWEKKGGQLGGDSLYRKIGKRSIDLSLIVLSAPTILPLVTLLAILVGLRLGRPILFRQQRPGYLGRPFNLFKLRSMVFRCNSEGQLLPDEERISRIGSFLRSTSLDELPELLNVLRGEMSLVGPRPLLMQYLDRYSTEQARRHEVRPGITGWAQVNGRNALSWEDKFKLDVWYVDHVSFWLDLKILWMTLWKVLKREGISAEQHATMPEFMGTMGGKL
jgi:sugar transferase EpsL